MATFKFTMTYEMTEEEVRHWLTEAESLGHFDVAECGGIDRIIRFLKTTAAVTKRGYEVNDIDLIPANDEVVRAVVEEAKSNGEFDDECEQCGGTEDLCCVVEKDGRPVYTCGKCAADKDEEEEWCEEHEQPMYNAEGLKCGGCLAEEK